jgi:uncharacterized membrane protein YvlD (DUF360 family)
LPAPLFLLLLLLPLPLLLPQLFLLVIRSSVWFLSGALSGSSLVTTECLRGR